MRNLIKDLVEEINILAEETIMERQYEVTMVITVDDDVINSEQTVDELVLDALEEAPFQVDTVTVTIG